MHCGTTMIQHLHMKLHNFIYEDSSETYTPEKVCFDCFFSVNDGLTSIIYNFNGNHLYASANEDEAFSCFVKNKSLLTENKAVFPSLVG